MIADDFWSFFFFVVVVDVCCPFLYSDGFHVTDM